MGGVVLREYLLQNPEIADKTRFIQFLSTPTDGTSLANICRLFHSPQIDKLTTDIRTDYLGDLSRPWSNKYLEKIPSYCTYETRDTYYLFRVVRARSG